jgi:hypothetical protein
VRARLGLGLFRAQLPGLVTGKNYDRGSSTILRVVVVVQPQPKVLCMLATHPSSQDYERASGLSSKDDDVLGHAANRG